MLDDVMCWMMSCVELCHVLDDAMCWMMSCVG